MQSEARVYRYRAWRFADGTLRRHHFSSSQGLLLMIPTLYKLAGELTPFAPACSGTYRCHTCGYAIFRRSFRRYGGEQRVARCCVRQTSRKRKTLLSFRTSRR
ncbi:hypothetical protein ACLB1Q_06390 [Escherichia coli]